MHGAALAVAPAVMPPADGYLLGSPANLGYLSARKRAGVG
jgi:hypothetical protein